jgi:PhnB protein
MEKKVSPIPSGYHTVTPYLIVKGGKEALEFYKKAFGAVEKLRLEGPDGKIGHSEIKIGDSPVMLAEGCGETNSQDPKVLKGTPVMMHLYVENVDFWVERACQAGAKLVRPVQDHFYGDRAGMVEDPFGHLWYIATHKEDLTLEEIHQRTKQLSTKS